jgi:hypothetical protein
VVLTNQNGRVAVTQTNVFCEISDVHGDDYDDYKMFFIYQFTTYFSSDRPPSDDSWGYIQILMGYIQTTVLVKKIFFG